jgi:hypothetical protein
MSRNTSLLIVLMVSVLACTPDEGSEAREGMNAGECADGADNEGDGLYDCDDPDCFGAPDCDDVSGGDTDPVEDTATKPGTSCDDHGDCDAGYICVFGECIFDDFFAEDSEEGEIHGSGGGTGVELSDENCFSLPLTTYQVTGYSHGDTVKSGKLHAGNDCNGSSDTPVYAIYDGIVYYADYAGTWGTLIEVRHTSPDGIEFFTVYGHLGLSDLLVEAGDTVTKGQALGYLGTTSENGGYDEHLHFSIYTGEHPSGSSLLRGHVESLEGYEDPIPWMEEHGVHSTCSSECRVDGSISSSTVSLGLLESSGNVEAVNGLSKWSLVVDEDIVASESYTTGPSSDPFNASVDLSTFEFVDGSHTLALWVRDETGCTGDGPVDTTTLNCKAESYHQCEGDDVYYFNACGTIGARKERCGSDEGCINTSSTKAECSKTCGNGAVDSGEDCDGSELGGETCESLGYDGGELSCASCSHDVSACCTDESYSQCYSGDVYWYDSCGSRGSRKDNCDASTEGCQNTSKTSAECYYEAIDNTSLPTTCGTDSQDIFTATAVNIDDADTAPEITVTWEKCDGSAFSSTKTCHVRVGSHKSYGVVRETYTVSGSASKYSWETTFDAWTSSSDFDSESCDGTKEFYFTCDDGASTAHWYGKAAVEIKKDCP